MGLAIRHLQKAGPIRIGAIGLGTGTVAAYARPGDTLVFYEINPEVVRMARQYFTYLDDCRGQLQVVMGDARLSLVSELGLDRGRGGTPRKAVASGPGFCPGLFPPTPFQGAPHLGSGSICWLSMPSAATRFPRIC